MINHGPPRSFEAPLLTTFGEDPKQIFGAARGDPLVQWYWMTGNGCCTMVSSGG